LPPLAEVSLAASALAELRHSNRNVGVETLKRLLRRGSSNHAMCLYALVEAGDAEAIDVYLPCGTRAARSSDCLGPRDEPEWQGSLRVAEIEFAGMLQSAN
jgi:hypothetical protein